MTRIEWINGYLAGGIESEEHAIERVFAALKAETLTPSLAPFADLWSGEGGGTRFFGNFEGLSLSFCIVTDDLALIERFSLAIGENVSSSGYRTARHEYQRRQATKAAR